MNGTYPVGEIDDESKKLISVTRECLDEAIKICKPGVPLREIGRVMFMSFLFLLIVLYLADIVLGGLFHSDPIAKRNGFSVVRQYTAHGINELFHCSPNNIPHYAKNKAVGTMKAGMVS